MRTGAGTLSVMLAAAFLVTGLAGVPVPASAGDANVEHHVWEGQIQCAIRSNLVGTVFVPGCSQEDMETRHEFHVREGLRSLVVRMEWEATGDDDPPEMGIRLTRYLSTTSAPENPAASVEVVHTHTYTQVDGPPALDFRVDAGTHGGPHDFEHIQGEWELRFAVSLTGDQDVVMMQEFTVHYELHYDEHAAPWPPGPIEEAWEDTLACSYHILVTAATCSYAQAELSGQLLQVRKGIKTLSIALEWDPEDALVNTDDRLMISVFLGQGGISGEHLGSVNGTSPLEIRFDAGEMGGHADFDEIDDHWWLRFNVFTPSAPNLVLEQPFTLHHHQFYLEHADDPYSPLAD